LRINQYTCKLKSIWENPISTFIFCFIIAAKLSFSQQNKIDSLLVLVKKDKADTSKIIHLSNLCGLYMKVGEYDSSRHFGNSTFQLASIILKDHTSNTDPVYIVTKKSVARAYHCIGFGYYIEGDYNKALENHFAALEIRKNLSDKKGLALSYGNIGGNYYAQGNYTKALENHMLALENYEALEDKQGVANSYNNIGNVYNDQRYNSLALKNYSLALKLYEEIGDKTGISSAYNNIGNVYANQNLNEKALDNYFASLKIKEELGDKMGIAQCYGNLAIIYERKNDREKALESYFASLKLFEEIEDKRGTAISYGNIGGFYLEKKDYPLAIKYSKAALAIATEIGAREQQKEPYQILSKAYALTNNYKLAYEYNQLFSDTKDSLYNEESSKKITELNVRYENEKREQQIKLIKTEQEKERAIALAESKKQKLFLILVTAIAIAIAIIALIVFRSLRVTKNQKQIIELQKNEVSQQKDLIETHQKEIIDSITYAKRLQEAIMPPIELIRKHLPQSFVLYKPKDIVAGDFYWMETVPLFSGNKEKDELIFIAAADCTGHGVPGAMVSVVCSNALNRAIKEFNLKETGIILDKTRELVIETFEKSKSEVKDGMDISLLCIDKKNKKISWSGANNPLWYIQNNELKEIKANKQSIGATDLLKPFTTHHLEFIENSSFYLFTDGLADQFGGPTGKKFKHKQFSDLIIKNNNLTQFEQSEVIEKTFIDWKGKIEQVDDVCIIGIKL
jgi:serine phosphatase RsbU (regulator of sigma subunit)